MWSLYIFIMTYRKGSAISRAFFGIRIDYYDEIRGN